MHIVAILLVWLAIYGTALSAPPLLDDADATHAQAAQAMLRSGDWVTLHVNGIRYLEKPPLPYWLAACSLRLFGNTAFAIHMPLALAVLGLAVLGYAWARRVFSERAAVYTAIFLLISAGTFLFTRIFIPEALLSLFLGMGLYAAHRALEPAETRPLPWALCFWAAMALAVLSKGLVAMVFLLGAVAVYLTLTGTWHTVHRLRPLAGPLLFLVIAAPWHILAGLRNTGGAGGHGFFWFYFVNEHILRFLSRRTPRDYNKVPALAYWLLHLVWLFPWSLFAPPALLLLWRKRSGLRQAATPAQRTFLLLAGFSAFVLVFFSLSTNQEYYTYPVYLPLLMLGAAALDYAQQQTHDAQLRHALTLSYGLFVWSGLCIACALGAGLWSARALPFVADIGTVLTRRGVGDYTLSLSRFFDLTGPSFAALRLPATLALLSFALGPMAAWLLHRAGKAQAAALTVAGTAGVFLLSAHLALMRFSPLLSSFAFAHQIETLEQQGKVAAGSQVLLLGDQAFGSSISFYLGRQVELVNGRSTSMLFGSSFADAPPVFLTGSQLVAEWGRGPRKLLFVPAEQRAAADQLLPPTRVLLLESSGKALFTDRPLDRPGVDMEPQAQRP